MKNIVFFEAQKDVRFGMSVKIKFFSLGFNEPVTLEICADFG